MNSGTTERNDLTTIKGIGSARQQWLNEAFHVYTWKPFASFVVEFQVRTTDTQTGEYRTTVHHMESDSGTFWPDLKCEELCRWLRASLGRMGHPEVEASAMIEPVDASPTDVAITQIRAFQPPYAAAPLGDETGKSFPHIIRHNEALMLEVDFNVAGLSESGISVLERLSYSGQLQARNLTNGRKIQVNVEPRKLEPGREHYTLRLLELSLQPGVYKIGVLVKLEGVAPAMNYLELPLVQVV